MAQLFIGTSGWAYSDSSEKGGWVGAFYPNKSMKKLPYYSQFFNTAEFDSIYYAKFYEKMGRATYEGMAKSTPANFEFSVKVTETVTREKKLDASAIGMFEDYLQRIAPIKDADKLGAILFQMSPNFTVDDFRDAEAFLDKLPRDYDYALEFRHPSWQTEGALELLKHYNVAAVMTDSPDPRLQFLSDFPATANHAFIRLHGRNKGFWYNYLYSKESLQHWLAKANKLLNQPQIKALRIYFNNHYGAKAVINALEFKGMIGENNEYEKKAIEKARTYLKLGLVS